MSGNHSSGNSVITEEYSGTIICNNDQWKCFCFTIAAAEERMVVCLNVIKEFSRQWANLYEILEINKILFLPNWVCNEMDTLNLFPFVKVTITTFLYKNILCLILSLRRCPLYLSNCFLMQGLMQAVFDIGIPILGTLIWACPN